MSVWGEMNGQWFHTGLPPDSEGKIVGRLPKGLERARLNAITNEHGSLRVRLKKDGPLLNPRDLDLGVIEDDITGVEVIRYIAPVVQIKAVDEKGQQISEFKIAGIYEGDDELMHPSGFFRRVAEFARIQMIWPSPPEFFRIQLLCNRHKIWPHACIANACEPAESGISCVVRVGAQDNARPNDGFSNAWWQPPRLQNSGELM